MSKLLQIYRAKPNPAGRDKLYGTPKPEQLLGEWVDIRNSGTESVQFSLITLFHSLFDSSCNSTGRVDDYWKGGSDKYLAAGQIVRVHTGRLSDEPLMNPIDRQNTDWHAYANRDNFVLNNTCGDIITVTWRDSFGNVQSDTASYDRNQPEGAILQRTSGSKLVLATGYGR